MKATKKQAGKRSVRGVPGGKRTASARSARRIAPALRSVIEWPVPERFLAKGGSGAVAAVHVHVQAAAELRALLAVARAAKDHSHAEVEPTPDGSDETCPICRALARLSRAGGER